MSEELTTLLAAILTLGAAILSIAAGAGVLRFRDVLTKLHAATKPQVLGVLLMVIAIALVQQSWITFFALIPAFVFQSLTAPISAHMVGRASYRTGKIYREGLLTDQLEEAVQHAPEGEDVIPQTFDDADGPDELDDE